MSKAMYQSNGLHIEFNSSYHFYIISYVSFDVMCRDGVGGY